MAMKAIHESADDRDAGDVGASSSGGGGSGGGKGGGAGGSGSGVVVPRHRLFSLATNLEQGLPETGSATSFLDAVQNNLPEIQTCRAILQKPTGKRTVDDVCLIDKLYQSLELTKYFTKGTCIFEEGELGENFYLVFSGSVLVLLGHRPDAADFAFPEIDFATLEGKTRKAFPIRSMLPGETFGERALIFANERRSASVITSSDITELVFINRVVFTTLIQETQDISSNSTTSSVLEVSRRFRSNKDIVRSIFTRESSQRSERDLKFAVEYLKGVKFFARFAFEVRKELCRVMKLITANTNTVLFEQGQVGKHFYILFTGKVDVSVETVNRFEAKTENVVTTLCEGDYFGELALLEEDGIRRATVQCCEFCELLILGKDEFGPLIQKHSNEYHAQYAHLLKQNPYFVGDEWDDNTILAMCNVMSEKFFAYQSEICKQGSRATEMFLITRGECVVLHEDKHPITKEPVKYQLGRYGPNSILGCAEASGGKFHDILLRDYSIVAESPVKLLVLSRFDIFHLMTPEARASLQRSSRGSMSESISSRALKTLSWEKYRAQCIERVLTDAANKCTGSDPMARVGRGNEQSRRRGQLNKLLGSGNGGLAKSVSTSTLSTFPSSRSPVMTKMNRMKQVTNKTLTGSASVGHLGAAEDARAIINRVIAAAPGAIVAPRSCAPVSSSSSSDVMQPPTAVRALVEPGSLNLEQCRRIYRKKKVDMPPSEGKAKAKVQAKLTSRETEETDSMPSDDAVEEQDTSKDVEAGSSPRNQPTATAEVCPPANRGMLRRSITELTLLGPPKAGALEKTKIKDDTEVQLPMPMLRQSSSRKQLRSSPATFTTGSTRRSSLPAIQLSAFHAQLNEQQQTPGLRVSNAPVPRKLASAFHGSVVTSSQTPGTASGSSSSTSFCPLLWKPVHGICAPFALVGFRRDRLDHAADSTSPSLTAAAAVAASNPGNGVCATPNASTPAAATRLGSAKPLASNQEHHETTTSPASATSMPLASSSSTSTAAFPKYSSSSTTSITAFRVLGKYRSLDLALEMFRYVCSFETYPSFDTRGDRSRFAIYKEDEMTMALENFFSEYHLEDQRARPPQPPTSDYEFRVTDLVNGTGQRFACVSVVQNQNQPVKAGAGAGVVGASASASTTVSDNHLESVFVHVYQCFPTPQSAVRFARQMASSNLASLSLLVVPLFEWVSLSELEKYDARLADVERNVENLVAKRESSWKARKEAVRRFASGISTRKLMVPHMTAHGSHHNSRSSLIRPSLDEPK